MFAVADLQDATLKVWCVPRLFALAIRPLSEHLTPFLFECRGLLIKSEVIHERSTRITARADRAFNSERYN